MMSEPWQLVLLWGVVVGIGCGFTGAYLGPLDRGALVQGAAGVGDRGADRRQRRRAARLSADNGRARHLGRLARDVADPRRVRPGVRAAHRLADARPAGCGRAARLRRHRGGSAANDPSAAGNPIAVSFRALADASRSRDFWLIAGSYFVCGASTNGLIGTHLIPACVDHGLTEVVGAGLLAATGVFAFIGGTASGWLSDRFDPRFLLFWYYGLRGLSLMYLPFALDTSFYGLSLFAVFYGLDWIAGVPPTVRLLNRAMGAERIGIMVAWITVIHQVGGAAAAYLGGVLRIGFGTYLEAFVISGLMCIGAALMVLFIGAGGAGQPGRERGRRRCRPSSGIGIAPVRGGERSAGASRALITASIMLATIMQGVDNTIANVALPHMQGSLSATQDQIAWMLTSYMVSAAIMMPLTGWLAGQFGIKYIFLVSVLGFTVFSALAGSSTSLAQLVIYRVGQGICGAALVPLSQSVLLSINPPERHGPAMAMWGMGVMLGPIMGPAVGGWLTEYYSWRWVFYINLPVGLIAATGILLFIPYNRPNRREPFDFFGFITLSLSIGAAQMMLDRGRRLDWFNSTEICVEAAVAVLALYLFVVHTATASERSFLNRELLKSPNFITGTILMFLIGGILSGTLALIPTMLQHLMNLPVLLTGLVTAPRGFGTMAAMFIVGRLIGKVDSRLLILFGLALTALSLWQMTGFSLQMDTDPVLTVGAAAGVWPGLHVRAAQHAGAVDAAAASTDAGHRVTRRDAQCRRQRRDLDPRRAADRRQAGRPFAACRAPSSRQPAGAPVAAAGPVQPDRPEGPRRAQRRGVAASGNDRLYQRFRIDDGAGDRLDGVAAAGPPAGAENAVGRWFVALRHHLVRNRQRCSAPTLSSALLIFFCFSRIQLLLRLLARSIGRSCRTGRQSA